MLKLDQLAYIRRDEAPYTGRNRTGRIIVLRWIEDPSCIPHPPARNAERGKTRPSGECTHSSPARDTEHLDRSSPARDECTGGALTGARGGRAPARAKEEGWKDDSRKTTDDVVEELAHHEEPDILRMPHDEFWSRQAREMTEEFRSAGIEDEDCEFLARECCKLAATIPFEAAEKVQDRWISENYGHVYRPDSPVPPDPAPSPAPQPPADDQTGPIPAAPVSDDQADVLQLRDLAGRYFGHGTAKAAEVVAQIPDWLIFLDGKTPAPVELISEAMFAAKGKAKNPVAYIAGCLPKMVKERKAEAVAAKDTASASGPAPAGPRPDEPATTTARKAEAARVAAEDAASAARWDALPERDRAIIMSEVDAREPHLAALPPPFRLASYRVAFKKLCDAGGAAP